MTSTTSTIFSTAGLSPPTSILLRHTRNCRCGSSFRPHSNCRRGSSSLAAVASTATWTRAPLTSINPATADGSLFHISIDISDQTDLVTAHTIAGQYLQLRLPGVPDAKPAFLAIASPPSLAEEKGEFDFLVKTVPESTAEVLCRMGKGEVVELSAVMGKGFPVERIEDADEVFMFATGSGISPIRSLIESGINAGERSNVTLYYGARNLDRMAYQDRFQHWESSSGVKIVPVLSQPEKSWEGETGYVQVAFARIKQILKPSSTGAVLCGHKQMAEDVTSALVTDGVPSDKILMNF